MASPAGTPGNAAFGHLRPFEFLQLPGEIRNRIYRLLLVQSDPIENFLIHNPFPPYIGSPHVNLCGQLLRTCREIHSEATSILYGENTWSFTIYNNHDAKSLGLACPDRLVPFFRWPNELSPQWNPDHFLAIGWNTPGAPHLPRRNLLSHVTRINIEINYGNLNPTSFIVDGVDTLLGGLQKAGCKLEFSNVDCYFDPPRSDCSHAIGCQCDNALFGAPERFLDELQRDDEWGQIEELDSDVDMEN
ncbi:hypothetical protein QBC34DRAFT_424111 [Podospora aff. communis PSN243]|uniref:F-box domain-containing protein n=1 Tax=Podospora aff. communis PSN243 TaxID=3040156 RepID=A0AAV9GUC3_9PEZI|nr:hypothetical protein QBC34DRAFT_424111 [Podospora aff. communis PSN243]